MESPTPNAPPGSPPSSASLDLTERWQSLTPEQQAELDFLLAAKRQWTPLPGPQTQAFHSEADILLYGGAAGGGKTDLVLGLAHLEHKRSIVFRRHYAELKGLVDRSRELLIGAGTFNMTETTWTLRDGRVIELAGVQLLDDVQKFQGRPHDLKCFDELPQFAESQFRFLCGWLRSADSKQRKRIVATGNPPTSADGEWVLKFFAPWLDASHPRPAQPGELRWYSTIDGADYEAEGGRAFVWKGETIFPQSRTFIPARVADNPYLVASGYVAQLQALPEPLRSKMLYGSWTAGRDDDPWQLIPSAWVTAAQKRWKPDGGEGVPMDAIGCDVARGGADRTVLSPRHANWFAEQIAVPGSATPDGPSVAGLVLKHRGNDCVVNIDVIGVGTSVVDTLHATIGSKACAINGSSASQKRDRSGQLGMVNARAEIYWSLREALDPEHGDDLALPPDAGLLADLCAPRWKLTARGVQVESKEDIIKRIGRSPDRADSLVYAHANRYFGGKGVFDFLRGQAQTAPRPARAGAAPAAPPTLRLLAPEGAAGRYALDGFAFNVPADTRLVEVPGKYIAALERLGFKPADPAKEQ